MGYLNYSPTALSTFKLNGVISVERPGECPRSVSHTYAKPHVLSASNASNAVPNALPMKRAQYLTDALIIVAPQLTNPTGHRREV